MKRYICITKFITKKGDVIESEHGIAYKTLEDAANGQLDHMHTSEYTTVGFRIIELKEVKHGI